MPILMIDDDEEICQLTRDYLAQHHYKVDICHNTATARALLGQNNYQLILLDVMLGAESGLDFVAECRQFSIPVMMLSALGATDDRIIGLTRGANDYLGKPFDPRELVLRIASLISLQQTQQTPQNELHFGKNIYNKISKKLYHNGQLVSLTGTETAIFDMLAQNLGQTKTRESLCQHIIGAHNNSRVIDVHIASLRKKIHDRGEFIVSVRHQGYVLRI